MALSLVKAATVNASGTVTPNVLLVGCVSYNLVGNISINAPAGEAEGQLFSVEVYDPDGAREIAWHESYKGTMCVGTMGPGGHYVAMFLCTDGLQMLMGDAYS